MYLFFVRHFNDIDHIVPIVWKMSRDDYPVSVYCINPEYDIQNDYRLNFLKQLGVEVDFLYNHFNQNLGWRHRSLCFLTLKAYAIKRKFEMAAWPQSAALSKWAQRKARKIGLRLYELTKKRFYDRNWAQTILEQSGAKVLCFDWIRPKQYVVDVLLKAAKEMSIPVLALPHGVFVYTNESITIDSGPPETFEKLDYYDHVIVQNELYKELMARSGLDRRKIFVLGSARYCNEWMEQNKKILPRKIKPNSHNEKKLKVVFMTTKTKYRIDTERLLKTVDLLSKLDGIEVLLKPHTRSTMEDDLYENLPINSATDVSSVELCEWADVVMVIGSSIILEALLMGKPALYLKYLHENTTLYEDFRACWTIDNEHELQNALSMLQINKKSVPYSDEDADRFISDIVYGGPEKRDVLGDYEKFIVNCAMN